MEFNDIQSEKLADLMFDLAKGVLLGSLGLIFIKQVEFAAIIILIAVFLSIFLVNEGLYLLKYKNED